MWDTSGGAVTLGGELVLKQEQQMNTGSMCGIMIKILQSTNGKFESAKQIFMLIRENKPKQIF